MPVKIGIPVPTTADVSYNERSWPEYAAAVTGAGAIPVRLELGLALPELEDVVRSCAGFVLPGSPADVDPSSYGEGPGPATAKADPRREALDRVLLAHAAFVGKPVLAVCFGAQLLSVWRGGRLEQDLSPVPVNHAAGAGVAAAHAVRIARESLIAGLLTSGEAPGGGDFRRLTVNSSHHQAIADPGDSLVAVAHSTEDGIVEAVEGRVGYAAMVGVQWHPERSTAISAASRALFSWVVSEAEDRQGHTTLVGADAELA